MNEFAGIGNHNTAKFWEYDTRLGRRWNVDPVKKYHESPYATFANNPITFIDLDGADTSFANNDMRQMFNNTREKVTKKLESLNKKLEKLESKKMEKNDLTPSNKITSLKEKNYCFAGNEDSF